MIFFLGLIIGVVLGLIGGSYLAIQFYNRHSWSSRLGFFHYSTNHEEILK